MFAPDYSPTPYWWRRSPRPQPSEAALPAEVDVAVIGSGFTGLNAAIQTVRAGRHTLVLDQDAVGFGCSTRNGGQVSTSIKPGYEALSRRVGAQRAHDILREGHDALDWLDTFIQHEAIDCDFRRCGRFHGAHTQGWFESLAREVEAEPAGLETDSYLVGPDELASEIGSEFYFGGVVRPRHAALDPGRYHQGLVDIAQREGVQIASYCQVTGLAGERGRFELQTQRGPVRAREVLVATNGYTSSLTPWQRNRVIPIGSYIIATEKLPKEQIQRLFPTNRVVTDTRKLVVYYRACPEGERVVFGARVSITESDPTAAAPAMHRELAQCFPELAQTPISHAWMGFVAYTFDQLPHLGEHKGVHYAMGYCGSGVSLASYFGRKIGQVIVGDAEGDSPLIGIGFQGRPYYFGKPWFLAPSISFYRWADRRGSKAAASG